MAGWSGGTFTRARDWTTDDGSGIKMLSANFDEEDDNFASGINACRHKGGQNAATANLPMGGFIHTGVGAATARTAYLQTAQFQDAGPAFGTSGGAANVQTLGLTPALAAYATGQRVWFLAGFTNSASCTININGVGAKNILQDGGGSEGLVALVGGEIIEGLIYALLYDGTQFIILNPSTYGAYAGISRISTVQSIPNDTLTKVVADTGSGNSDTYGWIQSDLANSMVEFGRMCTVRIDISGEFPGGVGATSRKLRVYDADDASYIDPDYDLEAIQGVRYILAYSFVTAVLATSAQLELHVFQDSGGALNLSQARMDVSIADKWSGVEVVSMP